MKKLSRFNKKCVSTLLVALLLLALCAGCESSSDETKNYGSEATEIAVAEAEGSAGTEISSADGGDENTEAETVDVAAEFDEFTDELFVSELSSSTLNMHFLLSHPENYGITEIPITLGDLSEEGWAQYDADLEETYETLLGFDRDELSESQQLTYDILADYIDNELTLDSFSLYEEPLQPSTGQQANLPVLYAEYRFYGKSDVEDYLALIALTGDFFDQIIDYEQRKADAGLFMSDFACSTVISQCEDFIEDPDDHYLIETFDSRIENVDGLTDDERAEYEAQNESLVKEVVLPAYEKLADALTDLLGSGVNDKGLCYLPDGTEYYKNLLYYNTGCTDDVETIAQRIEGQRDEDYSVIDSLLAEDSGLKKKAQDVSLSYADPAAALEALQDEMLTQFSPAPPVSFTVSYIDECMADYLAPAFYITSPIDDYGLNSIYVNGSSDQTTVKFFTTLAHEGFPGHLYQTVMSYEAGIAPVRNVLNYSGYVEGWATYVEMIAYHYAGLDDDLAEYMMRRQSALLSLYATTDIGIHYDGWSFDDTASFWAGYGYTNSDSIRSIYELIVEEPTHYLKYYVGYLEFLRLRDEATEAMGDNYTDIAFHDAVLSAGPAPFYIVEQQLQEKLF